MTFIPCDPRWGAPLDLSTQVKNWEQDTNAANRRKGNTAAPLVALAGAANHLLANQTRVLANAWTKDGAVEYTGTAPLFGFVFNDDKVNDEFQVVRLLYLPRRTGTGDCYLAHSIDGRTGNLGATITEPRWPEDLHYAEFYSERGVRADAAVEFLLNTYNGFTVTDAVVQEERHDQLNPAGHEVCNPNLAVTGNPCLADAAEDLRVGVRAARTTGLGAVISWTAKGSGGAWATGQTEPGDETGRTRVGTVGQGWLNFWDNTTAIRAPASAGNSVDVRNAGVGTATKAYLQCAVFGAATAGNNVGTSTVRFSGPYGDVDIEIANDTTATWYYATTALELNTTVGYDEAGAYSNRVDVYLRCEMGGSEPSAPYPNIFVYGLAAWLVVA